jgi:hypothetical protein
MDSLYSRENLFRIEFKEGVNFRNIYEQYFER